MIFIGILIGTLIGMVLMGLMCASGQTHRCEECRERRAK